MASDLESLERRLNDLNHKLEEVHHANSSAKLTARLVAVGIVIVAIAGVAMLLYPLWQAYQDPQPYKAALQKEMTDNVLPEVTSELRVSMQKLGPEVGKLAMERVRARYDDVMQSVQTEVDSFIENLKTDTQEKISNATIKVEDNVRARLVQISPELNDDDQKDKLLNAAVGGLDAALRRAVQENLQRHIDTLADIETQLMDFPVDPELKTMTDTELSDKMNEALSAYALLTAREFISPETKETLRTIAK